MTRDEIKNTPELVDYLLDESVIADSREKLHKRMDEICNLAIKALEQQPCEDAISRQAVLDAMRKNHRSGGRDIDGDYIEGDYRECLYDDIISLPPVNPQYTEVEIQKMQDLEQAEIEKAYELGKAEGQESEDVISRQAVMNCFKKWQPYIATRLWDFEKELSELPPIKPQDCDTCEVGNPCLYCKHEFEPQESEVSE